MGGTSQPALDDAVNALMKIKKKSDIILQYDRKDSCIKSMKGWSIHGR